MPSGPDSRPSERERELSAPGSPRRVPREQRGEQSADRVPRELPDAPHSIGRSS